MNQIQYQKPALTYEQQLQLLQERNLIIENHALGLNTLTHISYYRLSAYCFPFRQRDIAGNLIEKFQNNTTLSDVLTFYEFDRQLRLLVMDAIERIEISIKTTIIYFLSHQYGHDALENPQNFHPSFEYTRWMAQVREEILRSKERFIEHFKAKYLGFPNLPIWMTIEVMSFGSISKLFKGLHNKDKHNISNRYGLHHKTLISWLHFLTYVRNICAHHARLWNKEFTIKPKLDEFEKHISSDAIPKNNRSFIALLILKYLLNKTGNENGWSTHCEQLLKPILRNFAWAHDSMDISQNWENDSLWSQLRK